MVLESLFGRSKEEEIVQKGVEMEMVKVDVGFDRLGDAVESPRRYGETKRKKLEDIPGHPPRRPGTCGKTIPSGHGKRHP